MSDLSELYDWMQVRFGFGDWDQLVSDEPYWQWRRRELIKLTNWMRRKELSVEDLRLIAHYCSKLKVPLEHWSQLHKYALPARRALQEEQLKEQRRQVDVQIERAIQWEIKNNPEGTWIQKLVRAQGSERLTVLARWKHERRMSARRS